MTGARRAVKTFRHSIATSLSSPLGAYRTQRSSRGSELNFVSATTADANSDSDAGFDADADHV